MQTGGGSAEERVDRFLDNIYDERRTLGRAGIIAQVEAFDFPEDVTRAVDDMPDEEWDRESLRAFLLRSWPAAELEPASRPTSTFT